MLKKNDIGMTVRKKNLVNWYYFNVNRFFSRLAVLLQGFNLVVVQLHYGGAAQNF
jgi:hypothetical protein